MLVQAWTAKFSPDSKHIATGSSSGNVNQYSVETGEKVQTFEGRDKFSMCVAYVSLIVSVVAWNEPCHSTLSLTFTFTIENRARTVSTLPVEPKRRLIQQRYFCLMLLLESSAPRSRVKSC